MRKKKLTGYRLHKERILFSGGEIIRTIKYPLVPLHPTQEALQFLEKFEKAVIDDDLKIRGDLNVNDYLEYSAKGKTLYTLFDFWKDSILAGVIWADSGPQLTDLVARYFTGKNELFSLVFESISEKYRHIFDKNLFIKNIISKYKEIVRNNITKENFYSLIKETLAEKYKNQAETIIQSLVDYLFQGEKPTKEVQFRKIFEYLGGDFSLLLKCNPSNLTFFIIPQFASVVYESNKDNYSLEKLLSIREEIFLRKNLYLHFVESIGLANREVDLIKIFKHSDSREETSEGNKKKQKKLPESKFNCFSNYLNIVYQKLLNNEVERVVDDMRLVYPPIKDIIDQHGVEIKNSLNFLVERAKLLAKTSLPLVNCWHEYRTVFGGKLQSWFTNHQKRKLNLDDQIAKLQEALQKAKSYLDSRQFSPDTEKEKKEILELMSFLEEFFTDADKSIKSEENYQVFNSLLSLIKRRLNFFYQSYIRKEGDETKVNRFDAFKSLYERVYKPVAFYGISERRRNAKFVNLTIPILEDGIENIYKLISYLKSSFSPSKTFDDVKKKEETAEDEYRKFLQFFWRKQSERSVNSPVLRQKYREFLQENTDEPDWEKLQNDEENRRYVFYKSPYAKGALKLVKIKQGDYLRKLEESVFMFSDILSSYEKGALLNDIPTLLDWIELGKNVLSLLLRFNTKEFYELNGVLLDNFHQAKTYKERFGGRQYSKNEFAFIVQSLILAEVRGAATLYSKREYTAKYSVQVVGSDKKFKLYYIPRDSEISISAELINSASNSHQRKQLMKNHFYALALEEVPAKKGEKKLNSVLLEKKELKPTFLSNEAMQKLFRLSSSPYQLQFLDKYLYRPKGWENIEITLNEWSFVAERRYFIEWDLQTKKPKLIPVKDGKEKRKNKLYVAIPFNLKPVEEVQETAHLKAIVKGEKKEEKDLSRLNYPILGIDVGEYGLAYCLASFNYDGNNHQILGVKVLKDEDGKPIYGFIEDKNIGNIKDKFAQIQQRARKGAFDEEDTIVSRVRENAIGALRNQIHFIVTQRGSSAVYEDSISNFETGSGRTTKIYNSVKRADTEFESEADKQVHKHVWGDGTKLIGRNVSAYASSYTCINCLHSLYEIKQEDLDKIQIIDGEGRIVIMTSPYGEIKGYVADKEKHQKDYQFKNTDDDLKAFRKIVRDFSRPPVGEKIEVIENYAKAILEGNKIENFRKRRGSSAIFVCPFCQFIADADIQAAFMMAVRGYLRFAGIVLPGETAGESFLKKTREYLKDIDRNEIINALSLKS